MFSFNPGKCLKYALPLQRSKQNLLLEIFTDDMKK